MAIRNIKVDLKSGKVKSSAKGRQKEYKTLKGVVYVDGILSVRRSLVGGSKPFEYLVKGEEVEILETIGTEYYRIKFGRHQTGYVEQQYIRRLDEDGRNREYS